MAASSSTTAAARPFFHFREVIEAGDLVFVHESHNTPPVSLTVAPGKKWSGRFGTFSHATMVGRNFGCKLLSDDGKGFIYLLRPSAELWTASVSHRTQILYKADIAMICLQLELLPGCVVIEAGTGSGSLSHMIARCVGDGGHLHTYEYNPQRAEQAAQEFADHGLHYVTCRHADVCADGWAYPGLAESSVDAVIFDLPQPWDAVPRVAPYVKQGGRLCCFSPCIEQIQRTKDILHENGFTRPEVLEVLVRTHDVHKAPPQNAWAAAVAKAEAMVEERKAARAAADAAPAAEPEAEAAAPEGAGAAPPAAEEAPPAKRQRGDGKAPAAAPAAAAPAGATCGLITKPNDDMRGHTGFLMFCTKMIKRSAEELAALEAEEAAEAEAEAAAEAAAAAAAAAGGEAPTEAAAAAGEDPAAEGS